MLSLTKDGFITNFNTIAQRVAIEHGIEESLLIKSFEKAFEDANSVYTCPAILKSAANKGKICGRKIACDGYCTLHKPKTIVESKSKEPEKSRRLNNADFDFVSEKPKPFEDNIDFWRKGLRTTEINGKTYKQHRTTRLLLQIQESDICVKGLMHKGKPIWRESLGNTILDWCNKSKIS